MSMLSKNALKIEIPLIPYMSANGNGLLMAPMIGSGCASRWSFSNSAIVSRSVRSVSACVLSLGCFRDDGGENRARSAGERGTTSILDAAAAARTNDGIWGPRFAI